MRKLLLLLCLMGHSVFAQVDFLLPKPQLVKVNSGQLYLEEVSTSIDLLNGHFQKYLEESGVENIQEGKTKFLVKKVNLIAGVQINQDEAYHLKIDKDGITIEAIHEKGAFYALQTLEQLKDKENESYPYCEIKDWPAFRIRGFMHDVGRSFIPIEELKEQIKRLSRYKINVFHWHLTEDLAWRLESEIFPELNDAGNFERFPGEYYKKEEVAELLEYAKEHQVIVIPEIDMPGHSGAFRRATGHDMQSKEGMAILKSLMSEVGEIFSGVPYMHIGTDEVHFVNEDFVPEMVDHVRGMGFKVISWNPGWQYKEGDIDMLQLWSYRGKQIGNIPIIDSKFHYINHFDPFADLVSLYRSNVLGQSQGSDQVAGSILAVWNDRKLNCAEDLIRENNFYPLMLTFSERLWRGGGDGYFDEIGVKFPEYASNSFQEWEAFEDRLLAHKSMYFKEMPFPYLKQSNIQWEISEAFPNGGNLKKIFPIEKDLLTPTKELDDKYPTIKTRGGTVYLRHVWGKLVPALYPDPKTDHTAYAFTWVYSPKKQQVGAWISFQDYSRSEKDLPPPKGKWDYKQSRVWVNGQELLPPVWKNTHTERNNEISLSNENLQSRPLMPIELSRGWNKLVLKLPVGEFSSQEIRLVKWMYTFVFDDQKGLRFSTKPDTENY
ncbi:family 20 glycosylhydrolase [Echinicola shivajiensis]|uniref:family 20 glycosylhydrolase n=1 Tax=Echinicola shivajiensis TaxID=1035916 RepID=UPI001BFBFA03|nr:family 20 glycosylhydrolase [Echinicola shivajiensis]